MKSGCSIRRVCHCSGLALRFQADEPLETLLSDYQQITRQLSTQRLIIQNICTGHRHAAGPLQRGRRRRPRRRQLPQPGPPQHRLRQPGALAVAACRIAVRLGIRQAPLQLQPLAAASLAGVLPYGSGGDRGSDYNDQACVPCVVPCCNCC